jgi:hypothetical protein
MKSAKIVVFSVELVCPECGQTVKDSKGRQIIRRDDIEALAWQERYQRKVPFECRSCHAQFVLPKSPFGKEA